MMNTDPIGLILAGFAIISALHHILGTKPLEKYALSHGMLSADRSVKLSALFLLVTAVLFFSEDLAVYGAYCLSGFLVLTAITIHKFWNVNDRLLRMSEGLNFLKNIFFAVVILAYYML